MSVCKRTNHRSFLEGDTVEDLLQVKDLGLDKTIQIYQAQEATKKQHANMSGVYQESVAAVRTPQSHRKKASLSHSSTHSPTNVPRLWWKNAFRG